MNRALITMDNIRRSKYNWYSGRRVEIEWNFKNYKK